MYNFIIALMVLLSVFLILIVLLQNSKSDGMSTSIGAIGGDKIIGAKNTANALEKLTWGLFISLITLALVSNLILKRQQKEDLYSANIKRASEQITFPDAPSNVDDTKNDK